jgi:hypothetical protein
MRNRDVPWNPDATPLHGIQKECGAQTVKIIPLRQTFDHQDLSPKLESNGMLEVEGQEHLACFGRENL